MGNVPADKKLQLVKMIRSEHQNNRMVMRNREEFLYGKGNGGYHEKENVLQALEEGGETQTAAPFSTFWFRFLIAAVLMAAFVMWDNSKEEFLGRQAEEVYGILEEDGFLKGEFFTNISW